MLLSNANLLYNVGLDMMDRKADLLFKLDNNVDLPFSRLTRVDPISYLAKLDSIMDRIKNSSRLEMKLIRYKIPKNPQGWIELAIYEELLRELQVARELTIKGCEVCPYSEDMWMEGCPLAFPADGQSYDN